MFQNLFSAAASAFALSAGMAGASEYIDGLKMGGIITTCQYTLNNVFAEKGFGEHMIESQFEEMTSSEQRAIIKLWSDTGATKCIHATHGHSH